MIRRIGFVGGVIAAVLLSVPAAYYWRTHQTPGPPPVEQSAIITNTAPAPRHAGAPNSSPNPSACIRQRDSVICAGRFICVGDAKCAVELNGTLIALANRAARVRNLCESFQSKVALMESQVAALEKQFAGAEGMEQRLAELEKRLLQNSANGESGEHRSPLQATVARLCGLGAKLSSDNSNSGPVLQQIESLFNSVPKDKDGAPVWPATREKPPAPTPIPTRLPAEATSLPKNKDKFPEWPAGREGKPAPVRVAAPPGGEITSLEMDGRKYFGTQATEGIGKSVASLERLYGEAVALANDASEQQAVLSQAHARGRAICAKRQPLPSTKSTEERRWTSDTSNLAELCARFAALTLNVECVNKTLQRLALLQQRLQLLREREARFKSLMERWLNLVALMTSHGDTGAEQNNEGTRYLLDVAIACYEHAYAIRRCDPSFIKHYGAQNCKHELAMIGVRHAFSDARQEIGDHLLWSFAAKVEQGQPALPMADDYNLFARKAGETQWTKLNSLPIKPASTWSGSGVTGLDSPAGTARLPSVWHSKYTSSNASRFNDLLKLLSLPPYQKIYFAEGYTDQYGNPTIITDKATRDNYVASQGRPVPTTSMEPLPFLLTLSQSGNPWLSRLMGLSWFNPHPIDGRPIDYLIAGRWKNDRTRYYLLRGLSDVTTRPVPAPVLTKADVVPMPVMKLPGAPTRYTEVAINLSIVPPTPTPAAPLFDPFDIRPVVYKFSRSDRGPSHLPVQTTGTFARVKRPDGHGGLIEAAPVALVAEKNAAGALVWGPVYRDLNLEYQHYRYYTVGVDPFLRESVPSNELSASAFDTNGPMAPPRFTARVFQLGDKTPTAAWIDPAWFSGPNPPQFVIQFEFDWPDWLDQLTNDLGEYRFFYRFDDPETYAQAGGLANVANWEGWSAATDPKFKVPKVSDCSTPPASSHYSCKPYTDANGAVVGKRYSLVTYVSAGSSDLVTAGLKAQLLANNDEPYKVIYFAMAAVDQPVGNIGPLTGPVPAQVLNLSAPPAPSQPVFVAQSSNVNAEGNVAVTVRVDGANLAYTYNIYRISQADLNNLTSGQALAAGCNAETDGAVLQTAQERAQGNLDKLTKANSGPLKPAQQGANWQVTFVDQVDGTRTQNWFYAASAVNKPGNEGPQSCPSLAMLIKAMMPPPKVIITAIQAGDGRIQIEWNKVFRPDIKQYEIYSTIHPEYLNRPRKMRLIAIVDKDGLAVAGAQNEDAEAVTRGNAQSCTSNVTGCVPYVSDWLAFTDQGLKAGTEYRYQIRAVNEQGVPSQLSDAVAASPFDQTPPLAPQWDQSDPIVDTKGSGAARTITLKWSLVPGDADAKFLVQRRLASFPAWVPVGGWLAAGTVTVSDENVAATEDYEYRIQAMDTFGNRGRWASSLFSE